MKKALLISLNMVMTFVTNGQDVNASFIIKNNVREIENCRYEVAIPCCPGNCLPGNYFLVFEDEFIGNELDLDKWRTFFSYADHDDRCHGDEPQVYLDENVTVNNGLSLLFQEDPDWYPMCNEGTEWKQYTSGMIESKTTFLYGIFEASVKIPSGQGFFPAFWLFGGGGEIDIFEFKNNYLNKPELTAIKWLNGSQHNNCTYIHVTNTDYSDDFHTYTVYWDPYYISWYIDGELIYTHYLWLTILAQYGITCDDLEPFHEYLLSESFPSHDDEENIIINLAGQVNSNPIPIPSELQVQYVRVWQKQVFECIDLVLNSFPAPIIKARSITVDGNITVNPGESHSLFAKTKILLKPGLKILTGGNFASIINPNLCLEPNDKTTKSLPQPNMDFRKNDSIKNVLYNPLPEGIDSSFFFFPNPVNEKLNIVCGQQCTVSIIDIKGNNMYINELKNKINIIDMSKFEQGLYVIKLILNNYVYTKRIVKL